jgi:hypothetical protein
VILLKNEFPINENIQCHENSTTTKEGERRGIIDTGIGV